MMKSNSLIIDLRSQMPWHKRYMSTTTTAMLWAVWLLLWRPVIIIVGILGVQKPHIVHQFLQVFAHVIENGFTALIACAISLWLWSNFVSSKSVKPTQNKSLEDYAQYFELSPSQLQQSRHDQVLTVYHNAEGKIVRIK